MKRSIWEHLTPFNYLPRPQRKLPPPPKYLSNPPTTHLPPPPPTYLPTPHPPRTYLPPPPKYLPTPSRNVPTPTPHAYTPHHHLPAPTYHPPPSPTSIYPHTWTEKIVTLFLCYIGIPVFCRLWFMRFFVCQFFRLALLTFRPQKGDTLVAPSGH